MLSVYYRLPRLSRDAASFRAAVYDFFTAELGRKGFSRSIAGENYNAQKLVERETETKQNAAPEGDVQLMEWDAKELSTRIAS